MALLRLRVLFWIFFALFGVIELRLMHLQLLSGEFWAEEAKKSRTGGRPVAFSRGAITDRHGRALARSEIIRHLDFVFQDFRRNTPAGQLIGATRLIREAEGMDGAWTAVDEVLGSPRPFVQKILSLRKNDLLGLSRSASSDLGFYVRRLVGLTEAEFRSMSSALEENNLPFSELVQGSAEDVVYRLRDQARAIAGLARSVDMEYERFVGAIDERIAAVEESVERAFDSRAAGDSVKLQRAIRSDIESRPRRLLTDIPYRTVYLLDLVQADYAGFDVAEMHRRSYPSEYENLAPTLIGWVGYPGLSQLKKSEEDLLLMQKLQSLPPESTDTHTAEHRSWLQQRIRHANYRADEEQGRSGLEALLEPVLRGQRGWRIVERDSSRNITRLLHLEPPIAGKDVRLTLDADYQTACERVMKRTMKKGAIVLLDVADGAILAMASSPAPYRDDMKRDYGKLAADPSGPLFPRAYWPPGNPPPPGSVFKVVVAAAALESGAITTETLISCDRWLKVSEKTTLKCLGSHGKINVATALEKSCNIFFYKVGSELGLEKMLAMAAKFGLGHATGFGNAEQLQLPAGSVSLREQRGAFQRTAAGITFTMRTAIGHGAIDDVTPLQIAAMMAVFGNGGNRVYPWLVDSVAGKSVLRREPVRAGLSAATLAVIRQGMVDATETGSARPRDGHDLRTYRVAAKTGTPQAAGEKDHAWIAGYFPHDEPKIAFALFFENSGLGGGAVGTPVLSELLHEPEFDQLLEEGRR